MEALELIKKIEEMMQTGYELDDCCEDVCGCIIGIIKQMEKEKWQSLRAKESI